MGQDIACPEPDSTKGFPRHNITCKPCSRYKSPLQSGTATAGWTTRGLFELGEGNRIFEANLECWQVKGVLSSAWIFIACIAVLSISMSKIPDELWSKQWWRRMAKGEVCCLITVGVFLEESGKGKWRVKFQTKLLPYWGPQSVCKKPWKTRQKSYGKNINCRSTNLDFPSPQGHCQIINVYYPGI